MQRLRPCQPSSNEETSIVLCPKQDLHHVWWKACQQTIVPDDPEHSWDGSFQLDYVMKEQGWKYHRNILQDPDSQTQ
ncbi:hypothetical protein PAXINDRAFT_169973 [Paxillus involutus ATCC 200175]|uniref:Uncharacterized protein n=1 Tax=Paxillus involutus ATCC 200175 TaxID=664439 RepID=A0A0C9TUV0_PAXIN|nr:hypothetical protein PAXINDRAFT_169973 [Paxillus involutus ATCC 200175]